jgi:hypothetical protein
MESVCHYRWITSTNMNMRTFFIAVVICLFSSCTNKDDLSTRISTVTKVLMLKVDYLTNTFEGGKEIIYATASSTFTTSVQYKEPSDFGNLKIKYQELNEILFDGDIIWAGTGSIHLPQNIIPASQFDTVTTADIGNPPGGFENIFNPGNFVSNYTAVWASVQKLVKVREYLKASPNASIKLFLYTPSVGGLDLAKADWIVFIKN